MIGVVEKVEDISVIGLKSSRINETDIAGDVYQIYSPLYIRKRYRHVEAIKKDCQRAKEERNLPKMPCMEILREGSTIINISKQCFQDTKRWS